MNSSESGKTSKAAETGRERQAIAPWQIPWKGWQDILIRTYEQSNEDRLLAVAGGAVFYGILALFPAITAMVSFYGLFAKPSTISDHLAIAADFLPADVLGIVKDQIARVVAKGDAKLSFAFVSSFLFATWSANGGMKAVLDALNVFYQQKERRGFIRLNIVSFAFTFSGLIAVLVAIGSVVALPDCAVYGRPRRSQRSGASGWAMASTCCNDPLRSRRALQIWSQQAQTPMAMDYLWQLGCNGCMDCWLGVIVLLPY